MNESLPMSAIDTVLTKRDVRHYQNTPVSVEHRERLIQAARMAGSAKNAEVNRLMLIDDAEVAGRLAGAGDFSAWIGSAPLIIGFVTPFDFDRPFDVGRMAQNIMIVAHSLGLATCPVTLHHEDTTREILGLPDDHHMIMVVTVGYPVAGAPPSPLKRVRVGSDELVHENAWR